MSKVGSENRDNRSYADIFTHLSTNTKKMRNFLQPLSVNVSQNSTFRRHLPPSSTDSPQPQYNNSNRHDEHTMNRIIIPRIDIENSHAYNNEYMNEVGSCGKDHHGDVDRLTMYRSTKGGEDTISVYHSILHNIRYTDRDSKDHTTISNNNNTQEGGGGEKRKADSRPKKKSNEGNGRNRIREYSLYLTDMHNVNHI